MISSRFVYGGLLAIATSFALCVVAADGQPTLEMIRERMEAIGIRSLRSADGHLVVSGPDSFENAMLLAWAGEVRQRVQSVIGLPLRFDARSVRVLVPADSTNRVPIVLEHVSSGGLLIHRLVLQDYALIQSREGLDAMCAAFLALYIDPKASGGNRAVSFAVPSWFHQGIAQVLTDEMRNETLDQAMGLWREGQLPPIVQIMSDRSFLASDEEVGPRLLAARGAFVLWLTDMALEHNAVAGLFRRLSGGRTANREWLREQLADGGDPDELWDRWMLSQRQVVRALGRLTLAHLEALQAEWYVQSGIGGIPLDVTLPSGADGMSLLPYRDQPWFTAVIRQKRYRIEMLAQGRPARFRELTAAYVNLLNVIESDELPAAVVGMAVAARRQWHALYETVKAAGGTWSEP